MFKIELKNNKSFNCSKEQTIFEAAKMAGVLLDHSCLAARCRSCAVRVLEGDSADIQEELVLSEEEKQQGFILSCNAKPIANMKLDIEDLGDIVLSESRTFPSKIDRIEKVTDSIIKVVLRLPPASNFNFVAGQYVNIIKGTIKRSYSIANNRNKDNKLEFYIKKYEGGIMSNYWFSEAKANDLVRIEGPQGTFFYRAQEEVKHLVLLATGTGIAPIKAILEQLNSNPTSCSNKKIWVVWGGRYEEDIFWEPKFGNLNLSFIPVLSRSKEEWNGARGYVQNAVIDEEINLKHAQVYACGSVSMIQDAKKLFVENQLNKDKFYADAFVSSN
jgi:CDP-4-dehydro-6-deoxyglucose reductase